MKTLRFCFKERQLLVLPLAILTCGTGIFAQTTGSNTIPVVNVQATQPIATVTNSGVFTVFRAGNTDATLNVWYDLAGRRPTAWITHRFHRIWWRLPPARLPAPSLSRLFKQRGVLSVVKTVVLTLDEFAVVDSREL